MNCDTFLNGGGEVPSFEASFYFGPLKCLNLWPCHQTIYILLNKFVPETGEKVVGKGDIGGKELLP